MVATPKRKKLTQLCHANLLKPYFEHEAEAGKPAAMTVNTESSPLLNPLVAASGGESAECPSNCVEITVSPPPAVAVLDDVDVCFETFTLPAVAAPEEMDVCEPDDAVLLGKLKNSEYLANLPLLLSHLNPDQISELESLIKEFDIVF